MRAADKYLVSMVCIMILGVMGIGIYASYLENQVGLYKQKSETYHTKVVETQVKYEGLRYDFYQIQRDLEDAKERLAAAEKRESEARARASRSRSLGSAKTSVPAVKHSHPPKAVALSTGGLRDITMYCPTGNRTASGKWPQRGMVATISRSIPFGSRILIDGLGEFVVEDRIGHGSEFDIFTPSCREALRFGRQHRRVTILSSD